MCLGKALGLLAQMLVRWIGRQRPARRLRRGHGEPFPRSPGVRNGQEKVVMDVGSKVGCALPADGWPPIGLSAGYCAVGTLARVSGKARAQGPPHLCPPVAAVAA